MPCSFLPCHRRAAVRRLFIAQQLRLPLYFHAGLGQPRNQQTLMLILRKGQCIGERAESRAYFAEDDMSHAFACHPHIRGNRLPPRRHHRVRDAKLGVELERARLHRHRARGRPRLRGLVENPHPHAHPRQPKRQHQARRPRADN
jgi:hypothetical protein